MWVGGGGLKYAGATRVQDGASQCAVKAKYPPDRVVDETHRIELDAVVGADADSHNLSSRTLVASLKSRCFTKILLVALASRYPTASQHVLTLRGVFQLQEFISTNSGFYFEHEPRLLSLYTVKTL